MYCFTLYPASFTGPSFGQCKSCTINISTNRQYSYFSTSLFPVPVYMSGPCVVDVFPCNPLPASTYSWVNSEIKHTSSHLANHSSPTWNLITYYITKGQKCDVAHSCPCVSIVHLGCTNLCDTTLFYMFIIHLCCTQLCCTPLLYPFIVQLCCTHLSYTFILYLCCTHLLHTTFSYTFIAHTDVR